MTATPQTADSLRCDQCGGSFRMTAVAPTLECPYCHHQQPVAPERLAALSAYRGQVDAHHAAAHEHQQHVDAWGQWYATKDGQTVAGTGTFFAASLAVVPVAFGVSYLLVQAGAARWEMLIGPSMMVSFIGGMIIYFVIYFARLGKSEKGAAPTGGPVAVACPSCGAPGMLTPGEAIDRCKSCGGNLVPTHDIMAQGVDAAATARRQAALARYRMERQGMVQAYSHSATSSTPYIVIGSFTFMTGMGTVVMTIDEFQRGKEINIGGMAILWGIVLALVGAMVVIYLRRRNRRRRTDETIAHLVRQHGGQALPAIGDVAGWLNHYWAGPFDLQYFLVGPGYAGAHLQAGPYAALLDYAPDKSQHMKRRIQVLIAADVPGADQGRIQPLPRAAQAAAKELKAHGFRVQPQEGGLLVRALPETEKKLLEPEALHLIAPVLAQAAHIAWHAGYAPASAT